MVKLAVPSFQIAILSNGSIGLHDPVFSPPLRLPIRFSSCMPRWQLLPCTIDLNFHMATSSAHPIFTQSICLWNIIICCNCGSDFELTWCQFQAPEPWLPKRDLDHSRAGSTKELGLGWLRSDVGENIWFIVNMSMIMKGDVVNLLQIVYIYMETQICEAQKIIKDELKPMPQCWKECEGKECPALHPHDHVLKKLKTYGQLDLGCKHSCWKQISLYFSTTYTAHHI